MAEKGAAAVAVKSVQETAPIPVKVSEPQSILDRMNRMYDTIARRAFEIFETNGAIPGRDLENWFKAETELLHPVKFNMHETEKALMVEAEVPGFTDKDLEISVEPTRLVITGKYETTEKKEKGKAVYEEFTSNELVRVIDLPHEVEPGKVIATLKDGVLKLELPKVTEAITKVEVKAA